VGARDRICVIGKNGKGKTTLLKLMAGVLEPLAGEVSKPLNVASGYFEQSFVSGLDESRTVLEEITTADPGRDPGRSRAICGGMLFEGDEALKKISILSGGEKSRVVLGKLIAAPYNLLLLDEPSNHLDLEANDALLAALDNFEGAVVMVTHNEMFLHALAERLIVFQGDRIAVYEGDYERFLEKVGWQEEGAALVPGKAVDKDKDKERPNQKDLRRLRSAVLAERAKALKPLEKRADDAEAEIESKETELESLNQAIIEASQGQMGQEIVEISRRMHQLKKEIDFLYGELDTLTRDIDEKKAHFDRELAGLTS
jgi:ATP-binding cassette subfamily F protein 3